jgi:hypothetical protein
VKLKIVNYHYFSKHEIRVDLQLNGDQEDKIRVKTNVHLMEDFLMVQSVLIMSGIFFIEW